MLHSIFIRHMSAAGTRSQEVLAHAIPNAADAAMLAHRIARSYPEFGANPDTRVCWFRDRTGLHEIWSAPEA